MTPDREAAIHSAVAALVAALLAAVTPADDPPERLLSIPEAAEALGIGRSRLYSELDSGRLRSCHVGRRRLIPSGALADYIRPHDSARRLEGYGHAATADLSPAGGPSLPNAGERTSNVRPVAGMSVTSSLPAPSPAPSDAPPSRAGRRRSRVPA